MKKIAFILLTTAIFLFTAFSYGQATVYKADTDYGNKNFRAYVSVEHVKNGLWVKSKDESLDRINLAKDKYWGYRNSWGESYRFKNAKKALRIIEFGAICVYENKPIIAATSNPDIVPNWEDNPYGLSKNHSFSIGSNGKIITFSKNKFLKALETIPSAYTQFQKYFESNSNDILVKIMEYNVAVES